MNTLEIGNKVGSVCRFLSVATLRAYEIECQRLNVQAQNVLCGIFKDLWVDWSTFR